MIFDIMGDNILIYPGCFQIPNNISVEAIDNRGNLASFSSYGSSIDVACLGVNILSTLPDDQYGMLSGTSMSSPQVAGIAAMIMGLNPDLSSEEVIARIKNNVVKSHKLEGKVNTSGRVDALAALTNVAPTPEVSVLPAPTAINNSEKNVENNEPNDSMVTLHQKLFVITHQ